MKIRNTASPAGGSKLEIQNNPTHIDVITKKTERKILVIVLNYTNEVVEIPVTLSIAEKSSIYCIVCCMLSGTSSVRLVTHQNHSATGGTSDLLCKTVLSDNAHFEFTGTISISKAAQKSHAYQRNENLVLGSDNKVTSEPKLEILANDVFCTHGSTTGYLDDEQVFYLQSRGLNRKRIESLLSNGFLLSGLDTLVKAGVDLKTIDKVTNEARQLLHVK